MTTPEPAPFPTPDQGKWAQPTAPMVPPGYTPSPPGDVAAPAHAHQASAPAADPARPTSMWLTLEGAAGTWFAVYDMNKFRPYLVIDGVRMKQHWFTGAISVPIADGSTGKFQFRSRVPGYASVRFNGRDLYVSPKLPLSATLGYFIPMMAAVAFGYSWFGPILGTMLGFGVGYGAAAWVANARERTVPMVVVMVGSAVLLALAVLGVLVGARVIT